MVEKNIIISKEYRLPYFDFGTGEKDFMILYLTT